MPLAVAAVVAFVRGDGAELGRFPVVGRVPVELDLDVVDRLARLELAARRLGGRIELRAAPAGVWSLLDLCGLRGEVGRQPEGREQRRVEEVVLPGDLAVDDVEDLEGEGRVAAFRVDPVGPEGGSAVGRGDQEP